MKKQLLRNTDVDGKIVSVDFDGTLAVHAWPNIGEPIHEVIDYVKSLKVDHNCKLILNTCRTNQDLTEAVEWCTEKGIEFDAVNENLQSSIDLYDGVDSRKIFADIYIDDKNVSIQDVKSHMDGGVGHILEEIHHFINGPAVDSPDITELITDAYHAISQLLGKGHTDTSMMTVLGFIVKLLRVEPLSPIENNDDSWSDEPIFDEDGEKTYSNKRLPSVVKRVFDDGRPDEFYDNHMATCIDANENPPVLFRHSLITETFNEWLPVTFPYKANRFEILLSEVESSPGGLKDDMITIHRVVDKNTGAEFTSFTGAYFAGEGCKSLKLEDQWAFDGRMNDPSTNEDVYVFRHTSQPHKQMWFNPTKGKIGFTNDKRYIINDGDERIDGSVELPTGMIIETVYPLMDPDDDRCFNVTMEFPGEADGWTINIINVSDETGEEYPEFEAKYIVNSEDLTIDKVIEDLDGGPSTLERLNLRGVLDVFDGTNTNADESEPEGYPGEDDEEIEDYESEEGTNNESL